MHRASPGLVSRLRRSFVVSALMAIAGASGTRAQEPILLQRLTGPIQLDGLSDEAAWQAIEPLTAGMHSPNFGDAPSERTEFRVAYDDEYLYVSGRMYDADPHGVRVTSLNRDNTSLSNDWFGLILDSFNDRETSLLFFTNPAGVRTDAVLPADGQRPLQLHWNTFWDSAAQRTGEGWFGEIRIPFSSLRFQQIDGRVTMGITLWRHIARKNETITYPAIAPTGGSVSRASHTQRVRLQDLIPRNVVYATPYVLAGGGNSSALNADRTAYRRSGQEIREIGLDVKYALTSNFTLDLTYNTDFAQAEADDQLVNLTRFSLFFPEKRLFFQERAGAFDFSTGGNDRIFYTRRVGLSGATQVPVHGGARLVGRVGSWDIAAMNMQTAAHDEQPGENFSVVRATRQVLSDNSYVGGILTHRAGAADRNLAYGLDGNLRLRGQDYLILNWAQTYATLSPRGAVLDHSLARARWERRTVDGLTYAVDISRVGAEYEPAMGFQLRSDYTRIGDQIAYGWRPGRSSALLRHTLSLKGNLYRSNRQQSIESARLGPEWVVEMKSGHLITLAVATVYEDLIGDFVLSSTALVPAGRYGWRTVTAAYRPPPGKAFRPVANLEAGTFFDGWQVIARVAPVWNVSRHLEVSGSYERSHVGLPERNQEFRANIVRLGTRAALDRRWSVTAFVQHSDASDALAGNVRVRFNPKEGNDFYLVYNVGANTDRLAYAPARPALDSQALLIKYARTFDLGF